jgi:cellulose synthase/poly-beta-1,6-N-acetylglucosamine synthase-like glycosyltransferase
MVIEKMSIPEIIFWFSLSLLTIVYVSYYSLCLYVVKTKKLKVKKNIKFRPKVSFVIPTWNEEKTISGKLKNTLALDYPKNKLEVIVIDSGSVDSTKKLIKKFKKVKLIIEKKRTGKANALNKAFKYCRGDIIIISDADSRLKEDIVLKSMPYFFDPRVGALTGKLVLINPDENVVAKVEKNYRNFYHLIRNAESILDSTPIFHGPFSAFRRSVIEDISWNSVADDTELAFKVRKKKYKTLLINEAVFWEYTPTNFSERIKLKQRRAHGVIKVMFQFFSTFFFNLNYGLFGFLIFPVEFFMHVISPILILVTIVTVLFLPLDMLLGLLLLLSIGFLIPKLRFFILTFLHTQFACLKGIVNYLFNLQSHKWEKIQGTRRYEI